MFPPPKEWGREFSGENFKFFIKIALQKKREPKKLLQFNIYLNLGKEDIGKILNFGLFLDKKIPFFKVDILI